MGIGNAAGRETSVPERNPKMAGKTSSRSRSRKQRSKGKSLSQESRLLPDNSNGAAKLLSDMKKYHVELASRCQAIQTEMNVISQCLATMGGRSSAPVVRARTTKMAPRAGSTNTAPRGPRGVGNSLKDFITKVLTDAGEAMRLSEISEGIMLAGYRTSSKNLPNQVSTALADMARRKRLRKLSRGLYSL